MSESNEYVILDRETGLPTGFLDVAELQRHACQIALRLAEAAGSRERVYSEVIENLRSYPLSTQAYLLPLVLSELLSGGLADALMIGLEVRPSALDDLRRRAT